MGDGLSIHLEVYLRFRGQAPWRGDERLPEGTTAADLPRVLGISEPGLAILVNGRNVPESAILRAGDEVAVLRQAEGGD
ncbi:MAG TPA: MoaD/ThiS family protein [Symbiobacteriaceae bacterium]|jgi:sulfur carrier protein ThiS